MSSAPASMIEEYSSELKFQMVIETLSPNKTLPQVAREKHIPTEQLRRWRNRFFESGPGIFHETDVPSPVEKELEPLEKVLGSDACWPW